MAFIDLSEVDKTKAVLSLLGVLGFGYMAFLDPYHDPRGFRIGSSINGVICGHFLAQFVFQFERVTKRS